MAVALVAAVFLMGQGKEPKLRDLVGKSLTLRTEDGRVWLSARARKTGGELVLFSDPKLGVGITITAEKGRHFLEVVEGPLAPQLMLGVAQDHPAIFMFRDGTKIVEIGEHPDGHGVLGAFDKKGKPVWVAPANARKPPGPKDK